ncbi:ADP-ribosyl cyclase/cyclic ADP-ribose hydrolase 1-like isoform X2 [Hypomesus transpacificus]|uniref:ADP-ribosyl cyclase/cyclic ADP-ribose hydrolase 1-like isoform X2 n=1 Tax=Hypomesus transpacificus TaxID=137520 RepID=UPI001F07EDDF|nr:ADP-ribosyl cyclase/cyclic ADP-ribose hydrolase 1-like isoform X2 [Hypomesus transpacificus]
MDDVETYSSRSKKRRSRFLKFGLAAVIFVVILAIILGVVLSTTARNPSGEKLKSTVITRCEKFVESTNISRDCQKLWNLFEQAYVGRDPCAVPPEAYNPLMAGMHPDPSCNRMLFWSKTKDLVHDFTEKRDCYQTLEDTLLGSVMDGLTWCGKEGTRETFTTDCPGWTDCDNNPVRLFWNRASAGFADAACGDVTAMLNGSIATPFSPASIFASIEVKQFNSTRMNGLNVVLVTNKNDMSNIQECMLRPDPACGACW